MSVTELKAAPSLCALALSSLLLGACMQESTAAGEGGEGGDSGYVFEPMGELAIQCDAYCQKEAALACTNGVSAEECDQDCVGLGEMYPSCEAQWNAKNQCMVNANMICDEDGYPAAGEECFDQIEAYGECLGSL